MTSGMGLAGSDSRLSSDSTENSLSTRLSTAFSSINANFCPMQLRGPAFDQFHCSVFDAKREGS